MSFHGYLYVFVLSTLPTFSPNLKDQNCFSSLNPKCHLLVASRYCNPFLKKKQKTRHLVIFFFFVCSESLVWSKRMRVMHIFLLFLYACCFKHARSGLSSNSQLDGQAVDLASNASFSLFPFFFHSPSFSEQAALKQADTHLAVLLQRLCLSRKVCLHFAGISLHTLPSYEISAHSEIPYEIYNVRPAITVH